MLEQIGEKRGIVPRDGGVQERIIEHEAAVGIDVRNGFIERRGVRPAAGAGGIGEGAARLRREREKAALPIRVAHRRPQTLVGGIVRAQRVAMHHEQTPAVQGEDHRIGQQFGAAVGGKPRSEQKIAVAVHDEAGDAAGGERAQPSRRGALRRIRVVVPHPRFEQIAEDVERVGAGGVPGEEVEKLR